MTKKSVVTIALMSALALLTACNTVEGAGRDVSSAGDAVSDAARDVQ